MSVTTPPAVPTAVAPRGSVPAAGPVLPRSAAISLALARILLGLVFLWAFLDKLLGLGFSTPRSDAWITGHSPTLGYLGHLHGALASGFSLLAGQAWVDVAFMAGLLLAGVALVLGVALRPAALGITVLMGALYLSSLPLETNPVIDEHLVYLALAWVLATTGAGRYFGLGDVRLVPRRARLEG